VEPGLGVIELQITQLQAAGSFSENRRLEGVAPVCSLRSLPGFFDALVGGNHRLQGVVAAGVLAHPKQRRDA